MWCRHQNVYTSSRDVLLSRQRGKERRGGVTLIIWFFCAPSEICENDNATIFVQPLPRSRRRMLFIFHWKGDQTTLLQSLWDKQWDHWLRSSFILLDLHFSSDKCCISKSLSSSYHVQVVGGSSSILVTIHCLQILLDSIQQIALLSASKSVWTFTRTDLSGSFIIPQLFNQFSSFYSRLTFSGFPQL